MVHSVWGRELMNDGFTFRKGRMQCARATKGTCKDLSWTVGITEGSVTGYKDVPTVGEWALRSAVAWQSMFNTIEADQLLCVLVCL